MDEKSEKLATELGNIDDVRESTGYYIWHYHGFLFVSASIAAFLATVGLVYVGYLDGISHPYPNDHRYSLVLLPIFGIVALYGYFKNQVEHLFIQELAAALGFSYTASASMETVAGAFFSVGHSQRIADVMTGSYKSKTVRMYSYQYTVGYGKNSHTYHDTVFEMNYGLKLPHIYMHKNSMFGDLSSNNVSMQGLEPVTLEGNFNSSYSLSVEQGKQMEIREIFQPDVMQDVLGTMGDFAMEISDRTVYLIQRGTLTNKQKFLDLLAAAAHIYDELLPGLASVSSDQMPAPTPQATSGTPQ